MLCYTMLYYCPIWTGLNQRNVPYMLSGSFSDLPNIVVARPNVRLNATVYGKLALANTFIISILDCYVNAIT